MAAFSHSLKRAKERYKANLHPLDCYNILLAVQTGRSLCLKDFGKTNRGRKKAEIHLVNAKLVSGQQMLMRVIIGYKKSGIKYLATILPR